MSNPQPGWYPDPAGNAAKLRYWDGAQWTDQYMDDPRVQQPQAVQPEVQPQPQQAASGVGGQASAQTGGQPFVQQTYVQQPYAQQPMGTAGQPTYPMTKEDQTLRLVAFVFALISTISVCWALIPLAWMIPMTVMCWSIYKGTRANTTAFGVLSLIFLSLVSGILLLVSTKNE